MGNTNSYQPESKAPEAVTYTSQEHHDNQSSETSSQQRKGSDGSFDSSTSKNSRPLSIRKVLLNKPQFQPNVSNSPFVGSPLMSTEDFGTPTSSPAVRIGSPSASRHTLQPDSFPSSFQSNGGYSSNSESFVSSEARVIHGFGPVSEEVDSLVPTIISWTQGGTNVYVTGTFNEWKHKIRLNRSTTDFTTVINFPPGRHRLKFIIDEEWKCSNDLLIAPDADGNLVNFIDVSTGYEISGLQCNQEGDGNSENKNELASPLGSPSGSYSNDIPEYLTSLDKGDSFASPSSTTDKVTKKPPTLPPHLEKVLLNSANVSKDDTMMLPVPNHVVLNHLYACSIRDGVMAVAGTTRYRQKYMSTVYYRPVVL
ncbi:galactose metabolism- protein [Basidiobolus ranarum]|uniref:Galactose metabolism- protein n=1 Tax=Basidiobolus ranarum TaxID=34480 RepID=A0ABR2W6U0_9FUNG